MALSVVVVVVGRKSVFPSDHISKNKIEIGEIRGIKNLSSSSHRRYERNPVFSARWCEGSGRQMMSKKHTKRNDYRPLNQKDLCVGVGVGVGVGV